MGEKPLVSIITPSYNQGEFIEDTLNSVKNQDYANIEHIVVDGNSTDNTLNILKKYENEYNLKWISEPDKGQSNGVNKGFRMGEGKIWGWLNSDDVYFKTDVISTIVSEFSKPNNPDVIYGDHANIDSNGKILRVRRALNWNYSSLLRNYSIPQPSTFFLEYVIRENPLDETLEFSMDLDYWLRLGRRYEFKHVNKILSGNRIYKGIKRVSEKAREESKEVRKKYLQKSENNSFGLFFKDKLKLAYNRLRATRDILELKNENLAFNSEIPSKVDRIKSQLDLENALKFIGIKNF